MFKSVGKKKKKRLILLPRGTPEAAAIPLISSPKGCGSVSAISGCRQESSENFKNSKTKALKGKGEGGARTSVMSTSSISLPLGTKAFAKSLMAWTMLTSLEGGEKGVRFLTHIH